MLINAYSTLRTLPALNFPHTIAGGLRDRSDGELIPHLNGFVGYVLNTGNGQMTSTLYAVMRHIQRVQNQISIEVESRDMDAFSAWAERANAIIFLPDGTVRDPSGRVLVSQNPSELDPQAQVPYPADAAQRKIRSEQQLAVLGIRVPASLPPVVGQGEVQLQSAADVALRSLALFAVAVRAESIATGDPIPAGEMGERLPLLASALSPVEEEFLQQPRPTQQQTTDFLWRYESLALLHWALSLTDQLLLPTSICDVSQAARIALQHTNEHFPEQASLRSTSELLDALDLHYRLHWLVRQAQLDKQPLPMNLEDGVIFERHYALNWLVRFEDKPWDEIDTPT